MNFTSEITHNTSHHRKLNTTALATSSESNTARTTHNTVSMWDHSLLEHGVLPLAQSAFDTLRRRGVQHKQAIIQKHVSHHCKPY